MNALHKMYPGQRGSAGHDVFKAVASAATFSAASLGYGYYMNRFRDKAHVAGVPVDLLAGSVLAAAALVCDIAGVGEGISPIMRDVGHAGLGAFFHTMGSGMGAQHSGVTRLLVDKDDVHKVRAALPDATVVGEIPKAKPGAWLSEKELAAMAK